MAVNSASSWSNTTDILVASSMVRLMSARIRLNPDSTADSYLQLFNSADATPGSTAPNDVIYIPAASTAGREAEYNIEFGGKVYATGLTWGVFTTATGGTAATTSAPYVVDIYYTPGG